jgi:hypothetical protein
MNEETEDEEMMEKIYLPQRLEEQEWAEDDFKKHLENQKQKLTEELQSGMLTITCIHMHSHVSHVNKRVLIQFSRSITSASEFTVASDLDLYHLLKQQVMSQPHANQKSWNYKTSKQAYQVNAFNNSSQSSKPNNNGSQNFHKSNISTENTIPTPLRGYNIITWKKAAKSYFASNNCTDAIKFESFRTKCLALAETAYETDEQDLTNYLQTYQVEISQFKQALDVMLIDNGLSPIYSKSLMPSIHQRPIKHQSIHNKQQHK